MNDKLQNDCNKLNTTTNNAVELVRKYKELIKTMKKKQHKQNNNDKNINTVNTVTGDGRDVGMMIMKTIATNDDIDNAGDDDDDRLFYDTKISNIDVHDDDKYGHRYDTSRASKGENRSSNGSHTSHTITATSRDSNSSTQTIPKDLVADDVQDDSENNDNDKNGGRNEVGKKGNYDIMIISDNDIDEDEDNDDDEDNDGIWKTTL